MSLMYHKPPVECSYPSRGNSSVRDTLSRSSSILLFTRLKLWMVTDFFVLKYLVPTPSVGGELRLRVACFTCWASQAPWGWSVIWKVITEYGCGPYKDNSGNPVAFVILNHDFKVESIVENVAEESYTGDQNIGLFGHKNELCSKGWKLERK